MLLDVMMPKVDGYQVLQQLKADGRLHNIPVIMISALNEIDSVVRCVELGAVDYLSKPFNPVLLKARVGASLEKKRLRDEVRAHSARMEEELESARQLQMSMVPTTFPQSTARRPIEIFAMMEPAREVGGDLYDFYDLDDGTLCFFIGDVSGKGVASALFMARTKNVIRLVSRLLRGADGSAPTPADIVTAVNRELCQDNAGMMFVTLFFGMLDPQTGDLRFTNAGHNPPYHLERQRADAGDRMQRAPAWRAGQFGLRDRTLDVGAGGRNLSLHGRRHGSTNRNDEFFAEERLEAVLRDVAGHPTNAIIKAVADAVSSFADGAPQSDDITALAIRRVGAPSV